MCARQADVPRNYAEKIREDFMIYFEKFFVRNKRRRD